MFCWRPFSSGVVVASAIILATSCSYGPGPGGPRSAAGPELRLVASIPAAGDVGAPLASSIELELDVPIAGETVGRGAVRLFSGRIETAGQTQVDLLERTITFVPAEPLQASLRYRVRISDGIRGLDGSFFAERIAFDFRTTADPTIPPPSSSTPPRGPDASLVQPLWDSRCVDCHGPAEPRAGLDLSSASRAREALVNVGSTQTPLLRVHPGNHARSYLLRKLLHRFTPAGMPMPPQPDRRLDEAELRRVAAWIDRGAQ